MLVFGLGNIYKEFSYDVMEELTICLKNINQPKNLKGGELRKSLMTLDSIIKEQSINLHPQLKHFLQNRSYEKALSWIEGATKEKGNF